MLAISTFMIIFGLVNVVVLFGEIMRMDTRGKKEVDFGYKFKNFDYYSPIDDDDPNSRIVQVRFLYDMITFVFLQGISLITHSLTLIQGVFGFF